MSVPSSHLLFVDDGESFRYAPAKALRACGFDVEPPRITGALTWLEIKEPVDLLLSDIVMPNGSYGVALARTARLHRVHLKVT